MSPQKYVTDLLKETTKTTCKPVSTLIDPNLKLTNVEEDLAVEREMCQCLVGRLLYLCYTRSNIAHTVSAIS